MHTGSQDRSGSESIPVPMLDVGRQNGPLSEEFEAAFASICASGAFVHGPACQELETAMAAYCETEHAVGCASGSDALLLALMLFDIGPGDEVLIPTFTFFATAGAVWRLGATPVFVDIDETTFNIDPEDLKSKITRQTKAIIPVHLFGQCADMTAIQAIAEAHDLIVLEDAAQAIGATHRGAKAGSMGELGCFSFYPTKNLGAFGDAGMLTTNNADFAAKLRMLRDHGQYPRYHHALVGLNSRLDTIQAAMLNIKLPHLDGWAEGRCEHAKRYADACQSKSFTNAMTLPTVASENGSVWNQYTVRVHGGQRDALQTFLQERNIGCAIYYPIPLHLQECFSSLGGKIGDLPIAEQAAKEVLSLPIYAEMTEAEFETVAQALNIFAETAQGKQSNAA